MLVKKGGLKCSKNNFLNTLKNPFYTGKLLIREWKDEAEQIVVGIHEAIIDEATFHLVQDIMNGRRKGISISKVRRDDFPLRGFLLCRICGKKLTASASKSRNGKKHPYYHCESKNKCGERFPAEGANNQFVDYLASLSVRKEVLELYYQILLDTFKEDQVNQLAEQKRIDSQIEKGRKRLQFLREQYLDELISQPEYQEMKKALDESNNELIKQRTIASNSGKYSKYVDDSLALLADIPNYYSKVTLELKQKMIGSIFPEKLIFDRTNYRTTKTNEVLALITNNIKTLEGLKKKKVDRRVDLSSLAP